MADCLPEEVEQSQEFLRGEVADLRRALLENAAGLAEESRQRALVTDDVGLLRNDVESCEAWVRQELHVVQTNLGLVTNEAANVRPIESHDLDSLEARLEVRMEARLDTAQAEITDIVQQLVASERKERAAQHAAVCELLLDAGLGKSPAENAAAASSAAAITGAEREDFKAMVAEQLDQHQHRTAASLETIEAKLRQEFEVLSGRFQSSLKSLESTVTDHRSMHDKQQLVAEDRYNDRCNDLQVSGIASRAASECSHQSVSFVKPPGQSPRIQLVGLRDTGSLLVFPASVKPIGPTFTTARTSGVLAVSSCRPSHMETRIVQDSALSHDGISTVPLPPSRLGSLSRSSSSPWTLQPGKGNSGSYAAMGSCATVLTAHYSPPELDGAGELRPSPVNPPLSPHPVRDRRESLGVPALPVAAAPLVAVRTQAAPAAGGFVGSAGQRAPSPCPLLLQGRPRGPAAAPCPPEEFGGSRIAPLRNVT